MNRRLFSNVACPSSSPLRHATLSSQSFFLPAHFSLASCGGLRSFSFRSNLYGTTNLATITTRTSLRYESTPTGTATEAKGDGKKSQQSETPKPPGYRKDPDPKGTSFQLNVLPVLYFVGFWALVAILIKIVFFSSTEKSKKDAKKKTPGSASA